MDLKHEASCLINMCNMPVDPGLYEIVKTVKRYMLKYAKTIGIGIDYNSSKQFGKLSKKKEKGESLLKKSLQRDHHSLI